MSFDLDLSWAPILPHKKRRDELLKREIIGKTNAKKCEKIEAILLYTKHLGSTKNQG
jgi:hypothetical protein